MTPDATSLASHTGIATAPVSIAIEGPIASLTLARPETRNALSLDMMTCLKSALADIGARRDIRVVLLQSDAPVFSSGHDLKELTAHRSDADAGAAFFRETFALCGDLMQAIGALPQPVIAALEGVATAAGCQLIASCDLAVAGAQARFATPGVNIGLFCATPAVALTRALAPKHAMEMLLGGEMIDAETAARFGLVNRVTRPGGCVEGRAGLGGPSRSPVPFRAPHRQARRPCATGPALERGLCACRTRDGRKPARRGGDRRHRGLSGETPACLDRLTPPTRSAPIGFRSPPLRTPLGKGSPHKPDPGLPTQASRPRPPDPGLPTRRTVGWLRSGGRGGHSWKSSDAEPRWTGEAGACLPSGRPGWGVRKNDTSKFERSSSGSDDHHRPMPAASIGPAPASADLRRLTCGSGGYRPCRS